MKEYIECEAATFPAYFKEPVLKGSYRQGWNHCLRAIHQQPAADVVEVRHGRWIKCKTILDIFKCSCCCDKFFDSEKYKYCPNCGAKMDGDINNG